MSIKFTHSAIFNVGDLQKEKFKFGEEVHADPFVVVHKGSYLEFNLILYPSGVIDGTNPIRGVCVGFQSRNEGKELKIRNRGYILKSDGSYHLVHDYYNGKVFKGVEINCCTARIADMLSELKEKDLLLDNDAKLCVIVEIQLDQSFFEIETAMEENIASLSFKNIGLCAEVYAKMMEGEDSADFEFVCRGTEHKFPIHKLIARERSPYFKNLFESHPTFNQEKSHEIGWGPAVTEEVRYFLYNDKVSEKFDAVPLEKLAHVAGMLELKKLVAICEKALISKITEENAWHFLGIADILGMKFLKNIALCAVTDDPHLAKKLVKDGKKKKLRQEVAEFMFKRGRAHIF